MKRIFAFALAVLMLVLPCGVTAASTADVSFSGIYDYDLAYEVLELVNIERAKAGVAPVVMNVDLLDTAMLRAAECDIYFSHTRPDGTDCFTAFDSKFTYSSKGENIAIGQDDAAAVMTSWMNSEGHKANILDPNFKTMGVGCFHQTDYSCRSWVQVFSSYDTAEYKTSGTEKVTVNIPVMMKNLYAIAYTPQYTDLDSGYVRCANPICPGETVSYGLALVNVGFDYSITLLNDSCFTLSTDEYFSHNGNKVTALKEGEGTLRFTVDGAYSMTRKIGIEHYYRYTYTVAPTCTDQGCKMRICYYCDHEEPVAGSYTDALGHSWDDGTVYDTDTSIIVYTCPTCGDTKEEKNHAKAISKMIDKFDVSKLSHSHEETVLALKAEYESLTEEEQSLVENYDDLEEMIKTFEHYHKGDVDLSGTINSTDLSELLGAYGTGKGISDINGDRLVNSTDLSTLLSGYGTKR